MQERQNFSYYENNSLKDLNQSGQGQNKQGKKSNYKYYKGGQNEKINMNTNDYPQNYPHYRNRGNRKNFQDMNSNTNPNFKKKNKKKNRDNNNDFQYQGNNAIEISQNSKDEYLEQQNNLSIGGNDNNQQNIFGNQYKKNQNIYNNNLINNSLNNNLNNTIGSINTNTNSNNSTNISSLNLTPQTKNQITSPIGYNLNNANNMNNSLNSMVSHKNTQNNLYINPKLIFNGNIQQMKDNNQDINLKVDKSMENQSEESLSSGRGIIQNQKDTLHFNKIQNELTKQEMYFNNKYLPQQNYYPLTCNMNNINIPLDNMNNNMNNLNNNFNNINNLQNMQNYNQNIINQINNPISKMNNINNGNNLSLRQLYENQNNKLFRNESFSQNYSIPNNEEINMNHKNIKKFQNQVSIDPNNIFNPSINVNMLNNLNYNGPNNKFNKNQNNMQMNMNNKLSLSSQGQKNTIPNFPQTENLNLVLNQNQQIPSMINMNYGGLSNRTFYIPQNINNIHMKNNYINNNHLNNINNKDFNNGGFDHNIGNNKKYQKQYNYNNIVQQQSNDINNKSNNNKYILNNNKNNINNDINNNINNYNSNNIYNNSNNDTYNKNNLLKNNNLRASKEMNNQSNKIKSQQPTQYLLCLNLKLDNNKTEIINFKSLEDCTIILKEMKEKNIINENILKVIQNRIYKTIEIKNQIFNLNLKKETYRDLTEINNKLQFSKKLKKKRKMIKNKSLKEINKFIDEEIILSKNDVKQSLNKSFQKL